MNQNSRIVRTSVIVAALGYFVDIYDLVLFSIVRRPSLIGIGITDPAEILSQGIVLFNWQMIGLLVGGILWGILGDKRGRLSVLFGSIFLYSAANIANGFVDSFDVYAALRFIAGIGLAGELGAGITLVTEIMSKETRGYGTMIVTTVGILGAVAAALVGDLFDWRVAYFVGGGLGLLLLGLRVGVLESGMFSAMRKTNVPRGSFKLIFSSRARLLRYVACIMIGVPIWYVVGILITLSPEIGAALGMPVKPSGGEAIMYCYIGLALGDFASGYWSQRIGSRKRAVFWFLVMTVAFVSIYLLTREASIPLFRLLCVALGFGAGYWAVMVTTAAEQFGTNIRSTVATTVPNFIRGAVVVWTSAFTWLKEPLGLVGSAAAVGVVTIGLAFVALLALHETYGKDLDYLEEGVS